MADDDTEMSDLPPGDMEAISGLSDKEMLAWAMEKGKRLTKYLRLVAAVQNKLAHVNRLPNELLVQIFHLMDPRPSVSPVRAEYMTWIKATEVCRYWHDVAVASPGLWSLIDVGNGLVFVQRCLERSKDRPLSILACKPMDDYTDIIKEIIPHAHRVRELRFLSLNTEVLQQLKFPMPKLELMLLQAGWQTPSLDWTIVTSEDQFSSLNRVVLWGVNAPWQSGVFRNLQRLELYELSLAQRPSMETVLDVLEASPALRFLTFVRGGPTTLPTAIVYPNMGRRIVLPDLEELRLVDSPINVAFMLAHLALGASTFLELEGCSPPNIDPNAVSILSSLPFERDAISVFEKARGMALSWGDAIEIAAYVQDASIDFSSSPILILKITTGMGFHFPLTPTLFGDVTTAFSAAPIEYLFIDGATEDLNTDDWASLFQRWPDILHIRLDCDANVFPLLAQTEAGPLPWQQLKTIEICVAYDRAGTVEILRALKTCIATRAAKDSALELLRVEDIYEHLMEKDLAPFRAIVRTVEHVIPIPETPSNDD